MSNNLTQLESTPSRTETTSPQSLDIADSIFNSNMAGAANLTLPQVAKMRGRFVWVRNQNNTAAVTINAFAGQTINGAATYVLAVGVTFTKPACLLYCPLSGTDWLVLAQTPL